MIFHEYRLPADDSHEIFSYFMPVCSALDDLGPDALLHEAIVHQAVYGTEG